jgi:hypothetical protein
LKLVLLGSVVPLTLVLAACGGATASPPARSGDSPAPSHETPAAPVASSLTSPPSPSSPSSPSAPSAASPEATAADRFFRSAEPRAEWFAESFLRQVPIQTVQQVLEQARAQLGAYQGVTGSGGDLVAAFEHGDVPTAVQVDGQGRFTGLFLRPPVHPR